MVAFLFLLCALYFQSLTFYSKAMPFNSTSSCNVFAALFSSEGIITVFLKCFERRNGIIGLSSLTVVNILLVFLPCVLVIHTGIRRFRQGSAVTHSDFFTYNLILTDLISLTGFIFTCGVIASLPFLAWLGICIFVLSLFAHSFLDILTCVERYLAVVHPITYRNLMNTKGIQVRNATIGFVWVISALEVGFLSVTSEIFTACTLLIFTVSSLIVVSFCSIAVLCVLVHPGPGESRQHVDRSKLRAFYTILTIGILLLLRIGGCVFVTVYYTTFETDEDQQCHFILFVLWTCLPSSLMPPFLYLQRTGKTLCCKLNGKGAVKNPRTQKQ